MPRKKPSKLDGAVVDHLLRIMSRHCAKIAQEMYRSQAATHATQERNYEWCLRKCGEKLETQVDGPPAVVRHLLSHISDRVASHREIAELSHALDETKKELAALQGSKPPV